MPPVLLLWLALGSFFAAGAIGVALLFAHTRRVRVPLLAAAPHGVFAGAGLILLLVGVVMGWGENDGVGPWPTIALIAFLAAATMGVTMFYLHAHTGAVPQWLGFAHGATALAGVLILLLTMILRASTGEPIPLSPSEVVDPQAPPAAPEAAPAAAPRPAPGPAL